MNKKLKAIILAALVMTSTLLLSGCVVRDKKHERNEITYTQKTKMNPGEHIISVPMINDIDPRGELIQYENHPGYEITGFSMMTRGNTGAFYGGEQILYVNTEEVECSTNIIDEDGNFVYLEFGSPTKEFEVVSDEDEKVFEIGEHVISAPISAFGNDVNYETYQYPYHEGYIAMGITTVKTSGIFNGGSILYKNTVPVKCIKTENGYNLFGTPVEKEMTMSLAKEE